MSSEVGQELSSFAEAMVRKIVKQHGLSWCRNTIDDAVQTLVLAGWQDFQNSGDLGLAKNRMVDRSKNLIRDHISKTKRHEPLDSIAELPSEELPVDRQLEYAEGLRRQSVMLSRLTERQQQIAELRMAEHTNEQIAAELGIGLRTVERELKTMREEIRGKQE